MPKTGPLKDLTQQLIGICFLSYSQYSHGESIFSGVMHTMHALAVLR